MIQIGEGAKMEREATEGPLPIVKVPVRSCTTELVHAQQSTGSPGVLPCLYWLCSALSPSGRLTFALHPSKPREEKILELDHPGRLGHCGN